jgi:hypothetical protein
VLRVEPATDGTARLSMTFAARPSGLVARALAATLGRLFRSATRRKLERDLDDIAVAAEAHAAP